MHLLLCHDVFIDPFQVIVVIELSQTIDFFHSKRMLEHLLRRIKEDKLESVTKVEWLWQDSKELWVLKGDRKPFLDDELVQNLIDLGISYFWILFLY